MPLWPDVAMDSVDMAGANPYKLITLPALTFGILKVKWGAKAATRILHAKIASGISRIHADANGAEVEHLQETQFALGPPHAGFQEYYLVLPNASFTDKATIEIKDPEAAFYAFPNPVRALSPATLYFSQAKDMVFPAQVRIYAEDGRLARSLSFATADASLTWDLKDGASQSVKPGLYYYRLAAEPLKVLMVVR
jgi:hypothetical protein